MEAGGVTTLRSILDKPLSQLTEEDISQLTREDCRKYLKEKGMRRPSWNKSQAIQQVISLKALLETTEDSGASALRKILISKPPVTPNSTDSVKETSGDANNAFSLSAEDTFLCRPNDSSNSCPTEQAYCQQEEVGKEVVAPRSPGATNNRKVGQMTIFYCGKVNVYDGVPPDKVIKLPPCMDTWRKVVDPPMYPNVDLQARAVMHLAMTSVQSDLDNPVNENTAISFPCQLPSPCYNQVSALSSTAVFQAKQTGKMTDSQQFGEKGNNIHDFDVEGQANRKVSLQRYREKRKDRGRFKGRKNVESPSSNLEVYLNRHVRVHTSIGQSTAKVTSSPHQSGSLQPSSSSSDNPAKISHFTIDLNEDVRER